MLLTFSAQGPWNLTQEALDYDLNKTEKKPI